VCGGWGASTAARAPRCVAEIDAVVQLVLDGVSQVGTALMGSYGYVGYPPGATPRVFAAFAAPARAIRLILRRLHLGESAWIAKKSMRTPHRMLRQTESLDVGRLRYRSVPDHRFEGGGEGVPLTQDVVLDGVRNTRTPEKSHFCYAFYA